MTAEKFNAMDFKDAMSELYDESNDITTIDTLKGYISHLIDDDNFNLALHLLQGIYEDDTPEDTYYYRYDYSMGTLETPTGIN